MTLNHTQRTRRARIEIRSKERLAVAFLTVLTGSTQRTETSKATHPTIFGRDQQGERKKVYDNRISSNREELGERHEN